MMMYKALHIRDDVEEQKTKRGRRMDISSDKQANTLTR